MVQHLKGGLVRGYDKAMKQCLTSLGLIQLWHFGVTLSVRKKEEHRVAKPVKDHFMFPSHPKTAIKKD